MVAFWDPVGSHHRFLAPKKLIHAIDNSARKSKVDDSHHVQISQLELRSPCA